MKIAVGIGPNEEILPLIKAGAHEFFCGIITKQWSEKYGYLFLNRRETQNANFPSYKSLGDTISLAHEHHRKIFIAFNAPYYSQCLYPEICEIISKVLTLEPDGLIIADLGLLLYLQKAGIGPPVILGGDFGLSNSYAIKLLKRFTNIFRITMQRYLTIKEIKGLISSFPDYEYEAFGMYGRCPFVGSHCFTSHASYLKECFCNHLINSSFHILFLKEKSYPYFNKAYENLCLYQKRERMISLFSIKGKSSNRETFPAHCGLCAIEGLKAAGVKYLKVVGRDMELALKVKLVSLAKSVIEEEYEADEIKRMYSKDFPNYFPEMCNYRYLCYY